MLATPSDAAGCLLVTRDVGLHYYLPPVETPLTRAAQPYRARETPTPFTPTVSFSIVERDTPTNGMSAQRSPSAAAGAQPSPGHSRSRRRRDRRPLYGVVMCQPETCVATMTLPQLRRLTLFYHQLGPDGADFSPRRGSAPAAPAPSTRRLHPGRGYDVAHQPGRRKPAVRPRTAAAAGVTMSVGNGDGSRTRAGHAANGRSPEETPCCQDRAILR